MSEEFPATKKKKEPPPPDTPRYSAPALPNPCQSDREYFAKRKYGMGVLGGIALMGIAIIWFVAGLAVNIIFFYPPILFLIGLGGFLKGLMTGNLVGGD